MKPEIVVLEQEGRCAAWSSIDVWSETQVKEVILTQNGLGVEYACRILES